MSIVAPRAPLGAAPMDPAAGMYPAQSKGLLRHADILDPLALLAWVISTTMPFSWASPFRYLAAAYFIAGLMVFARNTLPAAARAWPVFILPIMCVISALWAPVASDAMRKGVLIGMGGVVAIYAASRLTARQILTVYLAGEILGALLSIKSPTVMGGAWTGIFGQKNFLAAHMFILFVCSFAIATDKGSNRWIRATAATFVPIACALIWFAKSGTTTLLLGGAGMAMAIHAFVWQPATRVPHARTLIVVFGALIAAILALVLFGFLNIDIENSVLSALGKDSTLTGRTYLWETAERTMAEHPFTGVGADGFWRADFGLANSITRYFDYENYVHFSFHNSYLENGVALGYPGYWATFFLAGWAVISTALSWIRNQSILNFAFLILAVMIIVRSTAEIDLAQEFTGTSVLLFIGATRREKLPRGGHYPAYAPEARSAAPGRRAR